MNQVFEFFQKLFDTSDWPPRWHCGRWTEFNGWFYIISDLLIWAAYFAIPVLIIRYITRKEHARFIKIYYLFAAFILSCGATHFLDAIAFWVPAYRLNALVRFITAVLSWVTVFSMVKLLPALFTLKSQKDFEAEIQQRKKAEDQIRQLNSSLQEQLIAGEAETLAYKYALDESCIVAITNQKGVIQYVNDNFCKISRYSAAELIGQDHRIINSGYHDKAFIRNLWTTIAGGRIWKGELCNKAKDGATYWVDTTIVPFLGPDGKPHRYMAIRADITERKKAEHEIKMLNESLERKVAERTEQLELTNKELEAFSYSVSHDLRAPLRAINGYAAMVEEDYADRIDDNGKRQLRVIQENASQMGILIDDLLAFSKLGRAAIQKSMVNMNILVAAVVEEIVHPSSHPAAVKIGDLHPAMADKVLIKQVFINYISNAVKYSSKTPQPVIEINSWQENGRTIYSVCDNGTGFNMSYAHKLFGVFQRLHSVREFEGTGVGLAIVKRIVSRHGGEVWATGEIGKGATFYFSLPQ